MATAIMATALVMLAGGCRQGETPRTPEDAGGGRASGGRADRLRVLASIYPLYEFAWRVGGPDVEVEMIIPPGVEPHSFEPGPGDIERLHRADLIVFNGAGMEPWLEQILARARPERARILNASAGLELIPAGEDHETAGERNHPPASAAAPPSTPPLNRSPAASPQHAHAADPEHGHADTLFNPHTWMDPLLAVGQVRAIEQALCELAPARTADIHARADAFAAQLEALDRRLAESLSGCRRREVIITHSSLAYFCRRYGLVEIPISGLVHQAEPSPRLLAELARLARERGVRVVYHEREVSPRMAEALAHEIGGRVLPFDTFSTWYPAQLEAGRGYVALMEENLRRLCEGLDCPCSP
ncbi:MAG: metal ABC transporter substrate-binding protein [Candidatus Sumerlaeia bacterium]